MTTTYTPPPSLKSTVELKPNERFTVVLDNKFIDVVVSGLNEAKRRLYLTRVAPENQKEARQLSATYTPPPLTLKPRDRVIITICSPTLNSREATFTNHDATVVMTSDSDGDKRLGVELVTQRSEL